MHIRKQSEQLFSKIIDFIYLNDNPAVRREFYSQTKQQDCHARRRSRFLKIIASELKYVRHYANVLSGELCRLAQGGVRSYNKKMRRETDSEGVADF